MQSHDPIVNAPFRLCPHPMFNIVYFRFSPTPFPIFKFHLCRVAICVMINPK